MNYAIELLETALRNERTALIQTNQMIPFASEKDRKAFIESKRVAEERILQLEKAIELLTGVSRKS